MRVEGPIPGKAVVADPALTKSEKQLHCEHLHLTSFIIPGSIGWKWWCLLLLDSRSLDRATRLLEPKGSTVNKSQLRLRLDVQIMYGAPAGSDGRIPAAPPTSFSPGGVLSCYFSTRVTLVAADAMWIRKSSQWYPMCWQAFMAKALMARPFEKLVWQTLADWISSWNQTMFHWKPKTAR